VFRDIDLRVRITLSHMGKKADKICASCFKLRNIARQEREKVRIRKKHERMLTNSVILVTNA